MHFSPRFYRGVAIASVLSAITTLGLIFLPRFYQPVPDLDARMALGDSPAYVLRSWIYLFHPFLVFAAALGVAAACRFRSAGAASLGLAGLGVWAATEAGQQALTKVALDRTWRAAWPTADAAARETIQRQLALYDLAWDAMYFLILLAFFAGNVLLGAAVWGSAREATSRALSRWTAAAFWAAAGLTGLLLIPEFGGPTVNGTDWLYPLIQPAGRTLIGVWLWRSAAEEFHRPQYAPTAVLRD